MRTLEDQRLPFAPSKHRNTDTGRGATLCPREESSSEPWCSVLSDQQCSEKRTKKEQKKRKSQRSRRAGVGRYFYGDEISEQDVWHVEEIEARRKRYEARARAQVRIARRSQPI